MRNGVNNGAVMISDPIEGLRTARLEGDTFVLSSDDGRKALRLALSDAAESAPLTLTNVVVYTRGWNRKGLSFTAEAMPGLAATGDQTPHIFDHDHSKLLGVVTESQAISRSGGELDAVTQTLKITEPLGKRLFTLGIAPRYSVGFQRDETTRVLCSHCEEDMFSERSECRHWPGQVLEGGSVLALHTSGRLAETSQVFRPACNGTGADQLYSQTQLLNELTQHRQRLPRLYAMRNQDRSMDEKTAAKVTETKEPDGWRSELFEARQSLATLGQENELLRARVERMEATRLVEESEKIISGLFADGRLGLHNGDRQAIVACRAKDPAYYDEVMSHVPGNPAFGVGQLTGPAPLSPAGDLKASTYLELADRCRVRLSEDPTLNRDQVWIDERSKMTGGE